MIPVWDVVTCTMLLYVAIVTPVEVAFIEPIPLDSPEFMQASVFGMFLLNRIVDLIFAADLVINFFVPYEDKLEGIIVKNHRLIMIHYLKCWFWLDLISVIPFGVIGSLVALSVTDPDATSTLDHLAALRIVRLLRLIKLLRLLKTSRIIERWEASMNLKYATLALAKLAIKMLVACHWFACAWNGVSTYADNGNRNWRIWYGVENAGWGEIYLSSLYWSTMTLTTIGFGDIVPQNTGERVFVICAMFMGAFIYAQLVGQICGIFADMDPHISDYHKTIDTLNEYMDELKKTDSMDRRELRAFKVRLRRYFNQSKSLHKDKYYKAVLKMMSPGLQGQFSSLLYKESFESIFFFRPPPECDKLKRTMFIAAVACKMDSTSYPGLERIIFFGEKTREVTSKMFIIRKGIVGCGGKLRRIGDTIGDDIILENGTRRYLATTLSFVDCLTLTSKDLYDVLNSSDDFIAQRNVVRKAAVRLSFRSTIRSVIRRIRHFKMAITGLNLSVVERKRIPLNITIEDLFNKTGGFVFDDPNKQLKVTRDIEGNHEIILEVQQSNTNAEEIEDPVMALAALDVNNTTPMEALLFVQKWSRKCRSRQPTQNGPGSLFA